jgi:ribosome production factor 2
VTENPKTTLLLKGSKSSQIIQLALVDINALKQPYTIKFTKKNPIHPFEDPASLEFFSSRNDASLIVFGHTSKKRPHCLTVVRFFNHVVLDMAELYINPDTFRSISQFKTPKVPVGLKPLISFSGDVFASPLPTKWTLAKSLLLDLFKGSDASSLDAEGLRFMIHFSAGAESDENADPAIHMRVYRIATLRSGQKVPRVEVTEMGPRMDFRVGRIKEADESLMNQALKRPKMLKERTRKNIELDPMGDKIGRIHVGRQDLGTLQTRKMKGLKRDRDETVAEGMEDLQIEKVARVE